MEMPTHIENFSSLEEAEKWLLKNIKTFVPIGSDYAASSRTIARRVRQTGPNDQYISRMSVEKVLAKLNSMGDKDIRSFMGDREMLFYRTGVTAEEREKKVNMSDMEGLASEYINMLRKKERSSISKEKERLYSPETARNKVSSSANVKASPERERLIEEMSKPTQEKEEILYYYPKSFDENAIALPNIKSQVPGTVAYVDENGFRTTTCQMIYATCNSTELKFHEYDVDRAVGQMESLSYFTEHFEKFYYPRGFYGISTELKLKSFLSSGADNLCHLYHKFLRDDKMLLVNFAKPSPFETMVSIKNIWKHTELPMLKPNDLLFRAYCQSPKELAFLIDNLGVQRALEDRTICSDVFAGAVVFQKERIKYGYREALSNNGATEMSRVYNMLVLPLIYQMHSDLKETLDVPKSEGHKMIEAIAEVDQKILSEAPIKINQRDSLYVKKNIGHPDFSRALPIKLLNFFTDMMFDSEIIVMEGASMLIIDEETESFYIFRERPEKGMNLPGGKREQNETMHAAFIREIGEEGFKLKSGVFCSGRKPDIITISTDLDAKSGGYNWTWVFKRSEIKQFPNVEHKWIKIRDYYAERTWNADHYPWVKRVIINFVEQAWKSTLLQMPYTPTMFFSAKKLDMFFKYLVFNVNWNNQNFTMIPKMYDPEINGYIRDAGSSIVEMTFSDMQYDSTEYIILSSMMSNERIESLRKPDFLKEGFLW